MTKHSCWRADRIVFRPKGLALEFLNHIMGSTYTIKNAEKLASAHLHLHLPLPTLQQGSSSETWLFGSSSHDDSSTTLRRWFDHIYAYRLGKIFPIWALSMAKDEIIKLYGKEYSKRRGNTQRVPKEARRAHEVIRPTNMKGKLIKQEETKRLRLYELIWKRTMASQMSDALLEKTTIAISISKTNRYYFLSKGEVVIFDGFLENIQRIGG